jgi:hypothetical protein
VSENRFESQHCFPVRAVNPADGRRTLLNFTGPSARDLDHRRARRGFRPAWGLIKIAFSQALIRGERISTAGILIIIAVSVARRLATVERG